MIVEVVLLRLNRRVMELKLNRTKERIFFMV